MPLAVSTAIGAQTFPPPPSRDPASAGAGSNCQSGAPVRASSARTAALGVSVSVMSSIAEPTISLSSNTVGGESSVSSSG